MAQDINILCFHKQNVQLYTFITLLLVGSSSGAALDYNVPENRNAAQLYDVVKTKVIGFRLLEYLYCNWFIVSRLNAVFCQWCHLQIMETGVDQVWHDHVFFSHSRKFIQETTARLLLTVLTSVASTMTTAMIMWWTLATVICLTPCSSHTTGLWSTVIILMMGWHWSVTTVQLLRG